MIKLQDKSLNLEVIIRLSRTENYATESLAGARQDVNFIFTNFDEVRAYLDTLTDEVHNRVAAEVKRLAKDLAVTVPSNAESLK